MSPPDKLIRMANQIARNFAIQGDARAIDATAEHVAKFWDPRMRDAMRRHISSTGGEGLTDIARQALNRLDAGASNG